MNANIEAARTFYALINRNELPAVADLMDAEIVRIEPEGFPTAGTYRGVAEVQAHLAKGRGTWAEGTCAPEEMFECGDKVVAYLYVRVRLKTGEWVEGRFADGFIFRDGKIVQHRSFGQRAEAMAWAGIVI